MKPDIDEYIPTATENRISQVLANLDPSKYNIIVMDLYKLIENTMAKRLESGDSVIADIIEDIRGTFNSKELSSLVKITNMTSLFVDRVRRTRSANQILSNVILVLGKHTKRV